MGDLWETPMPEPKKRRKEKHGMPKLSQEEERQRPAQCQQGYDDARKMAEALPLNVTIEFDKEGGDGYGEITFGGIACMWLGDDGYWWTARITYWPGNRHEPPSSDIMDETKHDHKDNALAWVFHRVLDRDIAAVLDNWAAEEENRHWREEQSS